jgi:hypothetical protein
MRGGEGEAREREKVGEGGSGQGEGCVVVREKAKGGVPLIRQCM